MARENLCSSQVSHSRLFCSFNLLTGQVDRAGGLNCCLDFRGPNYGVCVHKRVWEIGDTRIFG